MKPTQITELFANIRKTFVSFFSILMFVALGVGIFLGISWVAPAMQNASDKLFDEGSFHDFEIQFPYCLTDADLKELAEVEGVSDVEAGYVVYLETIRGNVKSVVKVQSLRERINTLTVVEGEMPAKANEMALNAEAAERLGIAVGDTVAFQSDEDEEDQATALGAMDTADGADASASTTGKDGMKHLNASTYKVTALVHSPEFVGISNETYGFSPAVSGKVDIIGWVLPAAFDPAAYQNGYPVANVRCDGLRNMNSFSGDYEKAAATVKERIVALGTELADARYDDLHGQAQKRIDEAEKQLADAEKQIADGEKQLADGKAELERQRAEGEAKLADAYNLLLSYESQRAAGEAKLADGRARVSLAEQVLAVADAAKSSVAAEAQAASAYKADQDAKLERGEITQEQHDAALDSYGADLTARLQAYADEVGVVVPPIDHTNFDESVSIANALVDGFEDLPVTFEGQTMTVREARVKLAEAQQQLGTAEAEYNAKVSQLESGWSQYYAGQAELAQKVAEGEQKIADGEKQLEDAKELVAENEPKLEQAKEQLAAMKDYSWTVTSRAENPGRVNISVFSDVTNHLSFSMALLFVIVGLLVSYSAISRIVHEQITQIGTKKALGLRKREITLSFLLYAGIAVLAGAIVGTIVGVIAVEGIIAQALSSMFTFGVFPSYFGLALFLVVTLIELALVLVATYLACRRILKEHAVELLKGEKPPKAKTRFYEKWKLWEGLPLFVQTIVNNCMNDKRRVFSTVVGVAGCTALIVTAITLNNDVMKSYDRHYANVYGFSDIAYVDSTVKGAADGVEEAFKAEGSSTAQVVSKGGALSLPGGGAATVKLVVPADADAFSQVYHINPVAGIGFDPSAEGVWVSQAYAEHFGVKVGDEVKVEITDGVMHTMPILGFYEFWLTYHEMIIPADYYEREFDSELSPNVVIASEGGASISEMTAKLSKVEGFDSAIDDKVYQYGNFATFSSVSSAVVLIYLVLSALMAVVVLLNLNVMFIEEKKRDLIVLMINGFSVKDAKRYIYSDTIVLTAIGIILGIILGCAMGAITVGSMEPSTATFVKAVDGTAVLVGVIGSAVLSAIMCIIALRRIPKFDLTDINKF